MFQLSDLFPLNSVSMSAIWPRPLQSISSVSILDQTTNPPKQADVILERSPKLTTKKNNKTIFRARKSWPLARGDKRDSTDHNLRVYHTFSLLCVATLLEIVREGPEI